MWLSVCNCITESQLAAHILFPWAWVWISSSSPSQWRPAMNHQEPSGHPLNSSELALGASSLCASPARIMKFQSQNYTFPRGCWFFKHVPRSAIRIYNLLQVAAERTQRRVDSNRYSRSAEREMITRKKVLSLFTATMLFFLSLSAAASHHAVGKFIHTHTLAAQNACLQVLSLTHTPTRIRVHPQYKSTSCGLCIHWAFQILPGFLIHGKLCLFTL